MKIKNAQIGVIGSRSFKDKMAVYSLLDKIFKKYPGAIIVSGGAYGPDSFAFDYCIDYGHDILVCGAGWETYGKIGALMRNQRIADHSDIIIAFWDERSHGTVDCMKKAKRAGRIVYTYDKNTESLKLY